MSDYFDNGIFNLFKAGGRAAGPIGAEMLKGVTTPSPASRILNGRGGSRNTNKSNKPTNTIEPRIERKPGPWDEGYVKPNTTMEPTEKATLSEYLNPGATQETRVNGNDVVQSGMKMSGGVSAAFVPEYANSSFNQLLATTNTSGYQPFSSNQLPTTVGSPDSKMSPMTQAITNIGPVADGQEYANNLGRQGTKGIGPVADGQVYGNVLENSPGAGTKGIGPVADGGAYARSLGKGGGSTSRLDAALSDTAGMQSYMSKFSSGDQERLANRAFLDTEDSMLALRAKEAVNGVVYAGGQHYISGKSGDDQAVAINRGQARDISNGKSSAQSLLAAHIDKNKNASTPAEAQEPITLEKPGVKQSFSRTETITPGIDTSIPDTTAFNSNNGVDVPGFGKTGGYKPTSKKPEVDYSSIFSY